MDNKYKVHIRKKNGCLINVNEINGARKHPASSRWHCSGVKGFDGDGVVASEFYYETGDEDMAMEVYARAKRNLDARRYSVGLELPKGGEERRTGCSGRKPIHLGSC